MFLFSKAYKTPVSTYTDSYRPPCSVKKAQKNYRLEPLWRENKFVTQGLSVPPVQYVLSQEERRQLIKAAIQERYRNTLDTAAYRPEKYWLARSEEKYNPVFVNEDRYVTWRTGPYNSAAWNKYSTYLPLLPKETRMEAFLRTMPTPYVNQFEREMVTNMQCRLPVYTVRRRAPCQGYYSPCSGCRYCLRGMDYYVDGTSAIRRHLHTPRESPEYAVLLPPESSVLYFCPSLPDILPIRLDFS